ncbi:hypothetical protein CCACVL1_07932 [Corchorus capsularis]|uniref:Uncharacterized protein n=1 Tax=Corchorus capsularis TaxID=210143 RepID=A0A1R3J3A0_COCAP|nr:hypothetical protein CCACVL1_07932 [Corchorus capsularis]
MKDQNAINFKNTAGNSKSQTILRPPATAYNLAGAF